MVLAAFEGQERIAGQFLQALIAGVGQRPHAFGKPHSGLQQQFEVVPPALGSGSA